MINKTPIGICKSKKRWNIVSGMRNWPISYGSELLGVHFDAVSTNKISQVLDFSFIKLILLCISEKMSIVEAIEHKLDLCVMLLLGL